MPLFSVVMATRNRPALFRLALESVLGQSCGDFEIIVVNDGSSNEHQSAYKSILRAVDPVGCALLLSSLGPKAMEAASRATLAPRKPTHHISASSMTMISGPTPTISAAPRP